jgi:hypothetical protein
MSAPKQGLKLERLKQIASDQSYHMTIWVTVKLIQKPGTPGRTQQGGMCILPLIKNLSVLKREADAIWENTAYITYHPIYNIKAHNERAYSFCFSTEMIRCAIRMVILL